MVQVVDEEDNPIEDAHVQITYPQKIASEYDTSRGLSNDKGVFAHTGNAHALLYVVVKKDGFYTTTFDQPLYRVNQLGERELFNPEITAVLKRVERPIPMYALGTFLREIPAYDEPVGFDLKENDWVSPFGDGAVSDLIFELEGTYVEWMNHDSTLTLSFSNKGDGLVPFTASEREGSQLLSSHLAPENGYVQEMKWRRAIFPQPERRIKPFDRIKEYDENLNYVIRVRTVLDEDGNIESAHYGKIYGDMQFDPTWDRESYLKFRAYYLNPTTNDRNIEFAVGESLIEGIDERDEPSLP
ncbi:MAG: hypothetical protein ACQKBU_01375 [Verrucomicrobiales bacterium]